MQSEEPEPASAPPQDTLAVPLIHQFRPVAEMAPALLQNGIRMFSAPKGTSSDAQHEMQLRWQLHWAEENARAVRLEEAFTQLQRERDEFAAMAEREARQKVALLQQTDTLVEEHRRQCEELAKAADRESFEKGVLAAENQRLLQAAYNAPLAIRPVNSGLTFDPHDNSALHCTNPHYTAFHENHGLLHPMIVAHEAAQVQMAVNAENDLFKHIKTTPRYVAYQESHGRRTVPHVAPTAGEAQPPQQELSPEPLVLAAEPSLASIQDRLVKLESVYMKQGRS